MVSQVLYRDGRIVRSFKVALYRVMQTQTISHKATAACVATKTPARPSDEALIAGARAGNANDFGELVRRHSRQVYGLSFRVLKNREDAEDNLQNAFCKAYGKIRQFEGKSQFSTWLMRIAINEALMMLRKRRSEGLRLQADLDSDKSDRESKPDIRDSRADPERQYLTKELAARAFEALQPSLKCTFILQKAEGWTSEELAQAFDITKETIKSRVFRARIRMRERLAALSKTESAALQV
jgi:RNA polymerase sigma-70 factor (ECF subfamily)